MATITLFVIAAYLHIPGMCGLNKKWKIPPHLFHDALSAAPSTFSLLRPFKEKYYRIIPTINNVIFDSALFRDG